MSRKADPAARGFATIALLSCGVFTQATVRCVRRLGVWAVTREFDDRRRRYRVTHLPTGLSVSKPLRNAEALALLDRLHESCPDWQAAAPFSGPVPNVEVAELRTVVNGHLAALGLDSG